MNNTETKWSDIEYRRLYTREWVSMGEETDEAPPPPNVIEFLNESSIGFEFRWVCPLRRIADSKDKISWV